MLGPSIKPNINPRDYDLFVGMDVDKNSIDATLLDHTRLIKSIHFPHKPQEMLRYLNKHYPNKKVAFAYECGPTGYRLYDEIKESGSPCLVLAPSMIPMVPGHHVKTNRLDSRKIGVSLRGGELEGIHVPSPLYRGLRHLTQLRETYVKKSMGVKCRIKCLLIYEGIAFPDKKWTRRAIKALSEIKMEPMAGYKLKQLLKELAFHQGQVKNVTKQIRDYCEEEPELRIYSARLRSIPGIGHIVAMHVMARLGDWRNIRNGNQVSSFVGVVPREKSTGDVIRRGRITKAGDERLRSKIIQASWYAIQKDPELREFYQKILARHPKGMAAKKAITAVANKMCRRIAAVLKEERFFAVRRRGGTAFSGRDSIMARA